MRSDRQYENFILHIEWRHMEGGAIRASSSGAGHRPRRQAVFQGHGSADARTGLGQPEQAAGRHAAADRLRTRRTVRCRRAGGHARQPARHPQQVAENRCKGKGQWNVYDVVCVDGTVKLAVNGKFVNSIRNSSVKKGYLCLESEGAEIHFRNIYTLELPPGITGPENTAPSCHRCCGHHGSAHIVTASWSFTTMRLPATTGWA